jgi:hypothetical protein
LELTRQTPYVLDNLPDELLTRLWFCWRYEQALDEKSQASAQRLNWITQVLQRRRLWSVDRNCPTVSLQSRPDVHRQYAQATPENLATYWDRHRKAAMEYRGEAQIISLNAMAVIQGRLESLNLWTANQGCPAIL